MINLCNVRVNADPTCITFDTHSTWHLLAPCLMIPDGSTKAEHTSLLTRILSLLLEAEESQDQRGHGDDKRIEIPPELPMEFSRRFADFYLSISETDAKRFDDLLIERSESAPSFLHWLMVCFLCSAEKLGNIELYWNFWRKLSERAVEIAVKLSQKSRLYSPYGEQSKLILGMLFADTPWQQVKPEQELLVPGLELLLDFVQKAGENPLVFEAMSRFLFSFPQLFMPKGLIILAKHQKKTRGTHLFSGVNTVFYLERVLQKLLVLSPAEYKQSRNLREVSLVLLNAMIETGSSCAYFLRDHMLHSARNF